MKENQCNQEHEYGNEEKSVECEIGKNYQKE